MAAQEQVNKDTVEAFERMTEVAGRAQQMMLEFWANESDKLAEKMPAFSEAGGAEVLAGMTSIWNNWAQAWLSADNDTLGKLTGDFWADSMKLWSAALSGDEAAMPGAANRSDRRFAAPAWNEHPVFEMVKRSYLLTSHYLLELVSALEGLPEDMRAKLRFQIRQFVDAMSPANFAALNPEVIEAAIQTNGESLLRGLRNMLDDLKRGKLTMTDEGAFEVGRNLAATPGKVIYEDRMFQLIQYSATTGEVHEIPVLIFPPWINKFYILDLTAEKSFVRWAVDRGYTVFMVSWKQPGPEHADVTLDTYVFDGQVAAINKVLEITGAPATHTIGYCVAGTTLAATLAWLAASGEADRVRTATFFTAQVDFSEAGDLRTMVDEQMLQTLDSMTGGKGIVDGRWLAVSFNMLRPTDLIWNYVVNNYLKGRDYLPFDLLYWNSDPTNVPARWHREYLQNFYLDNLLMQPGAIKVAGVGLDLTKVRTPTYIQAGISDHIAPAVSAFKVAHALAGANRFMLAGSGHIAGVINPPSLNKYQYWTLEDSTPLPETLEAFQQQAKETAGSWWPDWDAWLAPQSGDMVPARVPGTVPGYPVIEDAPGRYVKERIA
ncbi:MAG: class I poly(R)-hydroxyalkanoic acid synthase [Sphingomonadaceae bacterium]